MLSLDPSLITYWTPYRGIETFGRCAKNEINSYWTPYRGIDISLREWAISNEKLGLKCSFAFLERGAVEELFTGVECEEWRVELKTFLTQTNISRFFSIKWGWSSLTYLPLVVIISEKSTILFYWTPYRGIETTLWYSASHLPSIEPLIGGLIRPCGNEKLEIRNEQSAIIFLGWTGEAGLHLITHC